MEPVLNNIVNAPTIAPIIVPTTIYYQTTLINMRKHENTGIAGFINTYQNGWVPRNRLCMELVRGRFMGSNPISSSIFAL